jgi:hypothetical protein
MFPKPSLPNFSLFLSIMGRITQFYQGTFTINVLQELVNQENGKITVYQLLGDTYLEVGLPQLAKNTYQKGLALAINTKNIPAQMIMNKGLKQSENRNRPKG